MKRILFPIILLILVSVVTFSAHAQAPIDAPEEQAQTQIGDLNGDGRVSIADIVLLNAYVKGKITLQQDMREKYDLNRDSIVDDADVAYLQGSTLGHKIEVIPAIPATCTQAGQTAGMRCTECHKVLLEPTGIDALGHDEVVDPGIKANSARPGKTAGSHCAMCGEVLLEQAEIPAKGYHWMLADNEFKILLIGNSFSEDASSCGSGMTQSQLYHILQNMLGEDIKITLGLLYSGGKGVHWYATQTEQKTNAASFYVITPESNVWTRHGSSTTQNALAWTDWDVVTLQPYDINFSTEQEAVPYPAGTDQKFYKLEAATEYMLDCIDSYAPQADVYCYMHWARSGSSSSTLNASLNVYQQFASFYPKTLGYVGTTSGNRYTNLIPVGLSIQNARTTYLATLSYNAQSGSVNLQTDPQIGLQRDGGHVTYNIGRYIAGLTFAQTIIPPELRAKHYTLPDIRITESIGKLPDEYTTIAQKAVNAATETWSHGDLSVTTIEGYTYDPTIAAKKTLTSTNLSMGCTVTEKTIATNILALLPADFAVERVAFAQDVLPQAGEEFTCEVTIRFGYTSLTVTINGTAAEHAYHPHVTSPTCEHVGYTTYTCECGDTYTGDEVAATEHSFTLHGDAVCDKEGCRLFHHCAYCDLTLLIPLQERYFVQQLSTAQQENLLALYTALSQGNTGYIPLPNKLTGDYREADELITLLYYACPELFQLSTNNMAWSYRSDSAIQFSFIMSHAEYQAYCVRLFDMLYSIHEETQDLTDWERSKYVYDLIIQKTTYECHVSDAINPHEGSVLGPLVVGRARCQGYSNAYQLCMWAAGLECYCVTGVAGPQNASHSWNITKLGDQYYLCDPTWDDSDPSFIPYGFFNVSDDQLLQHTPDAIWEKWNMPACNSMDMSMFVKNGTYVTDDKDVKAEFKQHLNQSEGQNKAVCLKLETQNDFQTVISNWATYVNEWASEQKVYSYSYGCKYWPDSRVFYFFVNCN